MEYIFGIILHSIGGFSSASFYVPTYKVKFWSWELCWISLGFVAWVIMPFIGGFVTTPNLFGVLAGVPASTLLATYLFGLLWGFGGLMAGLGLRYLGLSLGQSICLGVCAIIGTIVPAIMDDKLSVLFHTSGGLIILAGLIISLIGIAFCGYAGVLKDKTLNEAEKHKSVKEFSVVKGLIVAVCGGIMSAFMAIAIKVGAPISDAAVKEGTQVVYMNIPIFVLALGGGFTANIGYSIFRSIRGKTAGKKQFEIPSRVLVNNTLLVILSGVMWYGQYFFYGMGATKMGKYDFASWTLHMATIILFSNLWGIVLKEWKLVNRKTKFYLWMGIILLIISVIMIGLGNHFSSSN